MSPTNPKSFVDELKQLALRQQREGDASGRQQPGAKHQPEVDSHTLIKMINAGRKQPAKQRHRKAECHVHTRVTSVLAKSTGSGQLDKHRQHGKFMVLLEV